MKIRDHVAVVTGGGRGVGAAICRTCAGEGAVSRVVPFPRIVRYGLNGPVSKKDGIAYASGDRGDYTRPEGRPKAVWCRSRGWRAPQTASPRALLGLDAEAILRERILKQRDLVRGHGATDDEGFGL